MQFVVINEIWEWLQDLGANPGTDTWKPQIHELVHRRRVSYEQGTEKVGLELVLATQSVSAATEWDEAILWITGWDIYPNHEDWPAYYALRAMSGEQRSIETAPGHKFERTERVVLECFLARTMQNGWDAYLIFSTRGIGVTTVVRTSHHQWVEIQRDEPIAHEPFAA